MDVRKSLIQVNEISRYLKPYIVLLRYIIGKFEKVISSSTFIPPQFELKCPRIVAESRCI